MSDERNERPEWEAPAYVPEGWTVESTGGNCTALYRSVEGSGPNFNTGRQPLQWNMVSVAEGIVPDSDSEPVQLTLECDGECLVQRVFPDMAAADAEARAWEAAQ